MGALDDVRQALTNVAATTQDAEATAQLLTLLPGDVASTEAQGIIAPLVAARKSWLHYDRSYRELSTDLEEIESDPEDERGVWISSWESDVDRAADGRERAAESIEALLGQLAELLGE